MTYRAPVQDIVFTMRHVAGLDRAAADGLYGDLSVDLAQTILEEAGRFANDVIAPLNREGDRHGATLKDGAVTTAPGWKDAYRAWTEAGWNALPGPVDYGGQGLPTLLNSACVEMWNSASMAFGIGPVLTMGAIEALIRHGSDELRSRYLDKLVSGEWTATMNLTEPQAGSDLAAIRSRAERAGDGTYRITGQKIFITYGEHDLTDNIVHLVLARLPDAPAGTRGISLFLVPKFLPDGTRNDVRCHSHRAQARHPCLAHLHHDLRRRRRRRRLAGRRGESRPRLHVHDDEQRPPRGRPAGRGDRRARLSAGARLCQRAPAGTRHRRCGRHEPHRRASGRAAEPAHHEGAHRRGARDLLHDGGGHRPRASRSGSPRAGKKRNERASLLTPVAKAFSTDIGVEVASLGVQVHGGMGYVEETGAAQHLRDARIAPIYEGTNGIQAIDLVTRKLPLAGGETVRAQIASMRAIVTRLLKENTPAFGATAPRLRDAIESLDRATSHLLQAVSSNAQGEALAGATPYLRLFALAQGGAALAEMALAANAQAAAGDGDPAHAGRIALCRFFAENIAIGAKGLEDTVLGGAGFLQDANLALAS